MTPPRLLLSSALLVCLVVVVVVSAGADLPDPDIWWNVAAGLVVLDTGAAPPDIWFGHHGCPDALPLETRAGVALLGLAWRAGGLWGLVALRAAAAVMLALVVAAALRRKVSDIEAVAWGVVVVAGVAYRLSPRPELFSLVLLAGWLLLLRDAVARPTTPRLVALAALVVAWGFCHPMYAVTVVLAGAVLVATAGLAALGRLPAGGLRGAGLVAVVVVAAAAVTPRGLRAVLDPLPEAAHARALGFLEWQTTATAWSRGFHHPSLGVAALLVVAVVVAAVVVAAGAGRGRREPTHGAVDPGAVAAVVPALLMLVLAVGSVRAVAPFVVAAVFVVDLVPARLRQLLAGAAVLVGVAGAIDAAVADPARSGRGLTPTRLTPLHAADAARALGAQGLLYGPLHASNWFLLQVPSVDVVWSGRRTYAPDCGMELLRGRTADGFGVVDDRLRPAWVLVDVMREPGLARAAAARGFVVVHADLRFVLLQRGGRPAADVDVDAVVALENRPLDERLTVSLLDGLCREVSGLDGAPSFCSPVR